MCIKQVAFISKMCCNYIHVSVRKVLEVVPPDTLVGVRGQYCSAITQAPQALHSYALPGVQQVAIQVLTTQTEPSSLILDRQHLFLGGFIRRSLFFPAGTLSQLQQ